MTTTATKTIVKVFFNDAIRRLPVDDEARIASLDQLTQLLSEKLQVSPDSFTFSLSQGRKTDQIVIESQDQYMEVFPKMLTAKRVLHVFVASKEAAPSQVRADEQIAASPLKEGQRITLLSLGCKGLLQVKEDGSVDGLGATGTSATQFDVLEKQGFVVLRSVAFPDRFVRIGKQFNLDARGKGGKFTYFRVIDHGNSTVSLASFFHETELKQVAFMGLLPDGSVKPADKTRTGSHGRFRFSVLNDEAMSAHDGLPVMSHPGIVSKALRQLEKAKAKEERQAARQAEKEQRRIARLALQSEHSETASSDASPSQPELDQDHVKPSPRVTMRVSERAVAKLVAAEKKAVVMVEKRARQAEKKLAREERERAKQEARSSLPAQAQDTLPATQTQTILSDGMIVVLKSHSSGANLRLLDDGGVDGRGSSDEHDRFLVVQKESNLVSLRRVAGPHARGRARHQFLRVNKEGVLDGLGHGGPYTALRVIDHGDNVISLQSAFFASDPSEIAWNVGILRSGDPKSAAKTKHGKCGRFTVSAIAA